MNSPDPAGSRTISPPNSNSPGKPFVVGSGRLNDSGGCVNEVDIEIGGNKDVVVGMYGVLGC